jgi:uncharacterized cupin superfamily protein
MITSAMTDSPPHVINVDEVEETKRMRGERWGHGFKPLTSSMNAKGGRLGVSQLRLPPGRAAFPFHYHALEDEAFFILSGRGVLRYGDEIRELRPGDCVSCPAGTKIAHQIANPFDEDLVYLAIGPNDPNEVCVYPDAGKVMVRSLQRVGFLSSTDYMEGEAEKPRIFDMAAAQIATGKTTST